MSCHEFDQLVAKEILNFEYVPSKVIGDTVYKDYFIDEEGNAYFHFSPTTNIADAWLVVEKMRKNKKFTLHDAFDENDNKVYYAQFHWIEMRYVKYGGAHADTAPLAICLAALKAVGFEVGHVEDIEGEGA